MHNKVGSQAARALPLGGRWRGLSPLGGDGGGSAWGFCWRGLPLILRLTATM